jgi:SagB-type dehydrogenase family enzyme
MSHLQITIHLPKIRETGIISITESLSQRRSIRKYTDESLTVEELSQLLWAGQGLTNSQGNRTSPSAGGLYPIELLAVVSNVDKLENGVYEYDPLNHAIISKATGDIGRELAEAALQQECLMNCPVSIIIAADIGKLSWKYGNRAERYVYMESGHVSQNIYLQATGMKLGTVAVGAFFDDRIRQALKLPQNLQPLYLMPIGHIKE